MSLAIPDKEAVASDRHRLVGLEPDNLLAFLALLGLLRALEAHDRALPDAEKLRPRASWDFDTPPLRPVLHLARPMTKEHVADAAAAGAAALAPDHAFGGRPDLNHPPAEARESLSSAARGAAQERRGHADLLAALMTDAAVKRKDGKDIVDPTPLCLLFGQGHQHFLDRFASVPARPGPERGSGRKRTVLGASECLAEALFAPWHRDDDTFSFRWDPEEDVRYALMAGDPTGAAYKSGTQHGANRLAALGVAALSLVPETRRGAVRPAILGGDWGRAAGESGFSFAWPVWRRPATLAGIRALLGHPDLRRAGAIAYLGVEEVFSAARISVGKFMNFTRGRVLAGWSAANDDFGR